MKAISSIALCVAAAGFLGSASVLGTASAQAADPGGTATVSASRQSSEPPVDTKASVRAGADTQPGPASAAAPTPAVTAVTTVASDSSSAAPGAATTAATSTPTGTSTDTTSSAPTGANGAAVESSSTTQQVSSVTRAEVRDGHDLLAATVIEDSQLATARGGADTGSQTTLNQNNTSGAVSGNVASQLTTGSNTISENSFSNSSGIPVVIQNSGNNVLIQNSTILNLQMTPPK